MALRIQVFLLKQMSGMTVEVALRGYILKQTNDLPYSIGIQTVDSVQMDVPTDIT